MSENFSQCKILTCFIIKKSNHFANQLLCFLIYDGLTGYNFTILYLNTTDSILSFITLIMDTLPEADISVIVLTLKKQRVMSLDHFG